MLHEQRDSLSGCSADARVKSLSEGFLSFSFFPLFFSCSSFFLFSSVRVLVPPFSLAPLFSAQTGIEMMRAIPDLVLMSELSENEMFKVLSKRLADGRIYTVRDLHPKERRKKKKKILLFKCFLSFSVHRGRAHFCQSVQAGLNHVN